MSTHAFSIDQLMELAGLAVAQAIQKEFAPSSVLVICGPGNNGGDGLVAARHLKQFGFSPEVLYPKPTDRQLYKNLTVQCQYLDIPIYADAPAMTTYKILIDAVFGFSFKGDIRPPFDTVIPAMKDSELPIVSVDIPSGWDVEQGNVSGQGLEPSMLVSLTAPKICAENYAGIHYVGGRFVPPVLA